MSQITGQIKTAYKNSENTRTFYLDKEKIKNLNKPYQFYKRFQDIVISLVTLIILLPFNLILALIIFIDDPHGSPIFVQDRVGLDGKVFKFYKFRSMYVNAEAQRNSLESLNERDGPVFKIKNDPRITRVGHFIRKASIDEILQFWNVLIGDMSIVGPRPPLCNEVEKYDDYQRQRLYVVPGLTCYWQIQPDRHSIPFDEWVEMDLKYITERSFITDWKIIFKTVKTIIGMNGV